MKMFEGMQRALAQLAIVLVLVASLPVGVVQAGLVSTDQVITDTFGVSEERARVEAFLARDDVREQMAALGVDADEAGMRVAALSDAEISRIAGELDRLPAGEGILTTIAIGAGVIFLILVITDIAGITNVFSFIR
jgi:hypothetical protein